MCIWIVNQVREWTLIRSVWNYPRWRRISDHHQQNRSVTIYHPNRRGRHYGEPTQRVSLNTRDTAPTIFQKSPVALYNEAKLDQSGQIYLLYDPFTRETNFTTFGRRNSQPAARSQHGRGCKQKFSNSGNHRRQRAYSGHPIYSGHHDI